MRVLMGNIVASVETAGFNNKGEPTMPRIQFRNVVIAFLAACSTAALALGAEPTANLKKGTPDLKSAGALAFGPRRDPFHR